MSPFSILGFEVRYYSLCWMVGLLLGYFIMKNLYKKQKISETLLNRCSCTVSLEFLWEHAWDIACSTNPNTILYTLWK